MIGDKLRTEVSDSTRKGGVVGERSRACEAEGRPTVEGLEVRMQT